MRILKNAKAEILEMVKGQNADLFIAGPAFNAGRYGVACGTVCDMIKEELGIPVVTGMYVENPGADMFKDKGIHCSYKEQCSWYERCSLRNLLLLLLRSLKA